MKFRLVILYSFILFTMSSCKLLVRIITGVRQPKIESSASVISFVKKNGINSDQIFYIDSAASWKFWELHQMENILDVRIYDSKGRLLKYLPQAQCSGTVAKNLREINLPALLPIAIASDSLSQVLRNFRRVDNKMLQLSDFKEGDFIVGIYCLKAFPILSY